MDGAEEKVNALFRKMLPTPLQIHNIDVDADGKHFQDGLTPIPSSSEK